MRHLPNDVQASRGCLGCAQVRGVGVIDPAKFSAQARETYLREVAARTAELEAAGARAGSQVRQLFQTQWARVPEPARAAVAPVAAPLVRGFRAGAGLSGLGASLPPGLLDAVVPVYAKEMKRLNPWFEAQGEKTAQAIIDALESKAKVAVKLEKPPEATWVSKFTQPMLDPFLVGLKRGLKPLQRTAGEVVVVGGVALMIGLGLSFLLGRAVGRRGVAKRPVQA